MRESKRASIASTGIALPERRLTNHQLEQLVDTTDEWIKTRTGISERRILEEDKAASDLAIESAREALKGAGLSPAELDLIILATATPDYQVPSTACLVQSRLGADHAAAFDLNAGCSGFVYGMVIGQQFIENGLYRNVLVIGVDILSRIINWEDRSTCVLFGDGAGAVVMQPSSEKRGVMSTKLISDGDGFEHLMVPAGGSRNPATIDTVKERKHFVHMNGNEVFKFAVRAVIDVTNHLLQEANLKAGDLDYLFLHQANLRIIESARKKLGFEITQIPVNIHRFGNMSAASIPVTLHEVVMAGDLKKGDLIALVAFGAGLTCGGVLMEW